MAGDCTANRLEKIRDGRALHGRSEFDIITSALQMRHHRSLISFRSAVRLAAIVDLLYVMLCPVAARAQDDGPASTREEILHNLQDVRQKYGSDAVMLEGHLLGQAVRGGSVMEAAISIPGIEERAGKRFLAFKLETGIIYNDRVLSAAARPARAWTDIVETTLRRFQTVSVPADGIALLLGWSHKDYADEADVRAHLREDHGQVEAAAFYLLLPDVAELIARRISAQELIDRSTVLVNGAPTRLILEGIPSPPN